MTHQFLVPTFRLGVLVSAYVLVMPACDPSSSDDAATGGASQPASSGGAATGGASQPTSSGGAATGGASQPASSGGAATGGSAARGGSGGAVSAGAGHGGDGGVQNSGGAANASGASGDSGAPGGGGAGGAMGQAGDGGAADGIPSIASIMADYHSYQPQTAAPVPVSSYIFGLCRLPTLKEQTFADSEHGNERYLQDWANEPAVSGIASRGQPPFAVGSVIVKEKYVPGPTSGAFDLVALGFMIKREPGFAPANGDWDFAYWEPELGVLSNTQQSSYCGGCHSGAADTDFVFVDGLTP